LPDFTKYEIQEVTVTKKHCIALADYAREVGLTEGQQRILADLLAQQNPRFNRERWLGYIAGTNGKNGGKR
jgi:hypothetical protein